MSDSAQLWFDVLAPEGVLTESEISWRPTIVGVHGGPGIDSTGLVDVLSPLRDVAQLVRYDQRGHGRSHQGTSDEWCMDQWADDLADLITGLGLAKPIVLGTSFGARVALACAARHPSILGGVVAAYGGARLDEALTVEAFRRLGGDDAARIAAGGSDDEPATFDDWLEVCWPLVSRSPTGPEALAHIQRLSTSSPDLHAAHMEKVLEQHQMAGLSGVTCPVLILGGVEDPLLPPPLMEELCDALVASRRVELLLLAEAGHPVFLDRPDLAYPAVRRFVADLVDRARTSVGR